MTLRAPFIITARLLPGVRVGNDSWISIESTGGSSDHRAIYQYHIDTPGFEHTANDLKSAMGGGSLQAGMESLLAFLQAAAESYRGQGLTYSSDPDENSSLFPQQVTEWAYQNSEELCMLELELQENSNLIEP